MEVGRLFIAWQGGGGGGGLDVFSFIGGKLYYYGEGLGGKFIDLGRKLPLRPPPLGLIPGFVHAHEGFSKI